MTHGGSIPPYRKSFPERVVDRRESCCTLRDSATVGIDAGNGTEVCAFEDPWTKNWVAAGSCESPWRLSADARDAMSPRYYSPWHGYALPGRYAGRWGAPRLLPLNRSTHALNHYGKGVSAMRTRDAEGLLRVFRVD